ncbi:hypothetical protein ACTOWA_00635 [Herbaspirillum seropedicae]|uniref:hypothetical protein n=1 Tax=Herbaspirillum seropedicae TaxID=964 RepID=UPI002865EBF1|nr:hypothetical protein [Herbaspirillum seropedicae]MDR6397898.1 hypothetical protein [Herbaspirillum seropedicae]
MYFYELLAGVGAADTYNQALVGALEIQWSAAGTGRATLAYDPIASNITFTIAEESEDALAPKQIVAEYDKEMDVVSFHSADAAVFYDQFVEYTQLMTRKAVG